ncbi:hypothetical protein [Candidatus Protochlamydia phocaeensis]|uniref:hypothetical protein n=1 Tax=Candidatus Protochlamydia phocaeensis TaxID=1414722 RepID=UPI0008380A9C|nr:hypothetical protein [Candidatus Protochlamydia phocaeensis]
MGPQGAILQDPVGPASLNFSFTVVTTDLGLPALTGTVIGFVTMPTGDIVTTTPIPLIPTTLTEDIVIPSPAPVEVYTATFFVDEISRGTLSQFGTLIITETDKPHTAFYNVAGGFRN